MARSGRRHAEFTLLALRNMEARVVFREHRADFEDQMVYVFADVLDRLGRGPEVPSSS